MAGASEVAKISGTTDVIVKAVLESIITVCKTGEDVRVNGFGTFSKVHREARNGRNPQTGEALVIPAKDAFTFKAAKTVDMSAPKAPAARRR